jgi:hypothetical protein
MEPAFTDGARIGRRTVSADGYARGIVGFVEPVVTIGAQAAERAEPERGPDRPRDTYEVAPPCRNFASLAFEAIRRASSGFSRLAAVRRPGSSSTGPSGRRRQVRRLKAWRREWQWFDEGDGRWIARASRSAGGKYQISRG